MKLKRFFTIVMTCVLCLLLFQVVVEAKVTRKLEIYDSNPNNPLQGTDSATTYVEGFVCSNDLNNSARAKAEIKNSNNTKSSTTSATFTNLNGQKYTRNNATDKRAITAYGYAVNYCYI